MSSDMHSGYFHEDQSVPVIWKIIRFSKNSTIFQSKRKYYKSGEYWHYITRPEALCKCCITDDKLTELKDTKTIEEYSSKIKEVTQESNTTGIFANGKELSKEEAQEMNRKIKQIKEEQLLWDCVLSFSQEFEDKYHLHSKEKIAEVIDGNIKKYFRKAGLDPDNLDYWFVVHDNTDNIHAHVGFMEKEPLVLTKNINGKEKLKYREFGKISEEANEFMRFTTQQYIENRREFFTDIKDKRKDINSTFRKQVHHDIKSNNNELNNLINNYLTDLRKHKNDSHYSYGELYKYAPEKQKQVREIVDYIVQNNEDLKFQFDSYLIDLQQHKDQLIKDNENNKTAIDKANKWYWKEVYGDGLYRRLGNILLDAIHQKPKKPKKNSKPPYLYTGINKPFNLKYNSLNKLIYQLNNQFGLAMKDALNSFKELQKEIHTINYMENDNKHH